MAITCPNEALVDRAFESLSSDMIAMDVGADVGYYTVKAAPRVKTVVAVEPRAERLSILQKNVEARGLKNVISICKALAATGGKSLFYESCSTAEHFNPVRSERLVDTVSLDSLVNYLLLDRLDLVKIDVQGDEVNVLRGATHTLGWYHPKLVIEVHFMLPLALRVLLQPFKNVPRFFHRLGRLRMYKKIMSILSRYGYRLTETGERLGHMVFEYKEVIYGDSNR